MSGQKGFIRLLLALLPAIMYFTNSTAQQMPFVVMEYNCENLFDCRHDTLKEDHEFTPDGERQWTFTKYWRKLNDIGRVIHQCGDYVNGTRHLPDIVALTEVENDSTLFMLTRRSMLKAAGYRYIITQSADQRGIDVAMLYNPMTFDVISRTSLRITPPKGALPTRDILYVKGRTRTDDTIHVFTVHAPSRSGRQWQTEHYRIAVAQRIVCETDSIRQHSPNANIIIAGDFNDYSNNRSIRLLCDNGFIEASDNAVGKHSKGTYKYQGAWKSLDHIMLSPSLARRMTGCWIHDPQWLLEHDNNGGLRPRRTYLGTHYHGGVSDHLPLVMTMLF